MPFQNLVSVVLNPMALLYGWFCLHKVAENVVNDRQIGGMTNPCVHLRQGLIITIQMLNNRQTEWIIVLQCPCLPNSILLLLMCMVLVSQAVVNKSTVHLQPHAHQSEHSELCSQS